MIPWVPPERSCPNVIVAVDPPTGWCVWTSEGIVAAGQGNDVVRAGRDIHKAVQTLRPRKIHLAVIEKPYGVSEERRNIPEVMKNCMVTGWWMRHFQFPALLQWHPTASSWRRVIGIPGADREIAKRHAITLVGVICRVQGRPPLVGPKGGIQEHASEAACMCLASWLKWGMVSKGDVSHRLIIELGIPYHGGCNKPLVAEQFFRHVKRHAIKSEDDDDGDDGAEGQAGQLR